MLRNKLLSLIAVFLLSVLIIGSADHQILAATADGPFTVEVRYFDSIQLIYSINYPTSGLWTGSADVPIGGLRTTSTQNYLVSQVYCVDPFIPFHNFASTTYDTGTVTNTYTGVYERYGTGPGPNITYRAAGESWGFTTIDTKAGYNTAAPWASSGAVRKRSDALLWLVLNGYRGNFRSHDAESVASLDRLNAMYGSEVGYVDKTMAVMATKVAIWEILTLDTPGQLDIQATSLVNFTNGDVWQANFERLRSLLIEDALSQSLSRPETLVPASSITSLNIGIADGTAAAIPDGTEFSYYGPLIVNGNIANIAGTGWSGNFNAFLNLRGSGVDFGDATIVDASGNPITNSGIIPGSSESGTVLSLSPNSDGVSFTSENFFIRYPIARDLEINPLTVSAQSTSTNVPVNAGTPQVFVSESSNRAQDWNAVQAFIGAALQGANFDLYAEASRTAGAGATGSLFIQKNIANSLPLEDTVFGFQISYAPPADPTNFQPINLNNQTVSLPTVLNTPDGVIGTGDASNGIFWLTNGEMASIDHLPLGWYYQVSEIYIPSGFDATPNITIPTAQNPITTPDNSTITVPFQMATVDGVNLGFVTFENNRTRTRQMGRIGVAKRAFEAINGEFRPASEEFELRLERSATPDDETSWMTFSISSDNFFITGANEGPHLGTATAPNLSQSTFFLRAEEEALILVDLDYFYRVVEVVDLEGDTIITNVGLLRIAPDGNSADGDDRFTHLNMFRHDDLREQHLYENRATDGFSPPADWTYYFEFFNIFVESHSLNINKQVLSSIPADKDRLFDFELHHILPDGSIEPIAFSIDAAPFPINQINYPTWRIYVLDSGGHYLSDDVVSSRIGTRDVDLSEFSQNFTGVYRLPVRASIMSDETLIIRGLVNLNYRVVEVEYDEFKTTFAINQLPDDDTSNLITSGSGTESSTFLLSTNFNATFTNTRTDEGNGSGNGNGNENGTINGNGEKAPATGSFRNVLSIFIVISLGFVCIIAARKLSKYSK